MVKNTEKHPKQIKVFYHTCTVIPKRRDRDSRVIWKLTASYPGVCSAAEKESRCQQAGRREFPNIVFCQRCAVANVSCVSTHILICQTINKWKEYMGEPCNRPTDCHNGNSGDKLTVSPCAQAQQLWELPHWYSIPKRVSMPEYLSCGLCRVGKQPFTTTMHKNCELENFL